MSYKVIAGPTKLYVKRFGISSEYIEINDEHVTRNSENVVELYQKSIHPICKDLASAAWKMNRLQWRFIRQQAEEISKEYEMLYFDGPEHIISTVPWKQAKYGEWFSVPKKVRMMLKKIMKEKTA